MPKSRRDSVGHILCDVTDLYLVSSEVPKKRKKLTKQDAIIAQTPNGMDVIHTHFSDSAYAHRLPTAPASMMASVTPGTWVRFAGAVR
jgi:hypothetical protein